MSVANRRLYIDVETTGFIRPVEIIQVSSILVYNDNIVEVNNDYCLPQTQEIAPDAYEVHGLSKTKLYGLAKGTFVNLLPRLYQTVIAANQIIGHNVSFDLGCIKNYNYGPINNFLSTVDTDCTMSNYLKYLGKEILEDGGITRAYPNLGECISFLINSGISSDQLHDEFFKVFPNEKATQHNSAYDVFITYKLHSLLVR